VYQEHKKHLEARAGVLKAMAHPTRLFILEQLREKEHSVRELTEMVGVDVSTVSKHLAVMRNCGIIGADKRGNQVFYTLRAPCILNFLGCVEAVLEQRAHDHSAVLMGKGQR